MSVRVHSHSGSRDPRQKASHGEGIKTDEPTRQNHVAEGGACGGASFDRVDLKWWVALLVLAWGKRRVASSGRFGCW